LHVGAPARPNRPTIVGIGDKNALLDCCRHRHIDCHQAGALDRTRNSRGARRPADHARWQDAARLKAAGTFCRGERPDARWKESQSVDRGGPGPLKGPVPAPTPRPGKPPCLWLVSSPHGPAASEQVTRNGDKKTHDDAYRRQPADRRRNLRNVLCLRARLLQGRRQVLLDPMPWGVRRRLPACAGLPPRPSYDQCPAVGMAGSRRAARDWDWRSILRSTQPKGAPEKWQA